MDKAGKYFLLGEMARGMYVVLEQFFRPPLVLPVELHIEVVALLMPFADILFTTRSRK